MGVDLDRWLDTLRAGDCLAELELKALCGIVRDLLIEEANVQPVCSPVTVCGDIHGQFFDLLELLKTGGEPPDTNYIFMGDFVDRGHNSVETLEMLLCLKARWPDCITLLRGNHESRQITQVYGFYEECMRKYGNANVWNHCVAIFDYLTIAAIIDGRILCVHGGLSPELNTVDQMRTLDRVREIPQEGAMCDLMWSDPEDIKEGWMISPRGAGYLFGAKVADEFCRINGLNLIARAHQLVMEGYKYHFPSENFVTVWSAPNYCYRCGNVAAVMAINEKHEKDFKLFHEVPESSFRAQEKQGMVPYFL